jgi:hypothetical protein
VWRTFASTIDYLLTITVWLVRKGWRYRAGLTPFYCGAAVLLGGLSLHRWAAGWWWVPAALGLVVPPLLFWFGDRLSGRGQWLLSLLVPDWIDDGKKGVLDRDSERGFLSGLLLVACGWLAWLGWAGIDRVTWWALVATVCVAGVPWWWHRGFRRRKRPNRWAGRWRHVGDSIKEFEGSRVIGTSGDRVVTELKVVLRPGLTVNHVGDRALQVASALSPRLRPGAVTLADGGAARRVTVRIVPRDPWGGAIVHPMPALGSVDLSRGDKVLLGRLEDRSNLMHHLEQHTMLVGQSGSGKSVTLDTLLTWMAIAGAPIVGIDMASGVSLGEWEPIFAAPVATNAKEALLLLRGVMNVIEHREREMRKAKVKKWTGEPLFVPIDEFPSLVKAGGTEIVGLLIVIAERARKTRVWLYPAAQNGTKADLGSTELRAQMMCTIGLRMDRHMSNLLWGDLAKQGWDCTSLQTGTMLLRDATRNSPRVAKGVLTTDAQRDKLVRDVSRGHVPALDVGSARALRAGLDVSPPVVVEQPSGTATAVAEQHAPQRVTVLESARSPLDDLDARVLDELPPVHQSSVAPAVLVEQLGASRDQIKRSLGRLAKRGQAISPKHGQWARTA